MAKDYTKHKMERENDLYPYLIEMGQIEFQRYLFRLHRLVSGMKPKEGFNIDDINKKEENRDMFIKMLCLIAYIYHGIYFFNESYTYFYREEKPRYAKKIVKQKIVSK